MKNSISSWRGINGRGTLIELALHSRKEGGSPACPNCGYQISFPHTRPMHFNDPQIAGEPVLATGIGIFVREDLALARNLRRPHGAFNPVRVALRTRDEAAASAS